MSVSSIAAVVANARVAQNRAVLAAVFARQNQRADAAVLAAIVEGAENLQEIAAAAPPGTGLIVDTSA